MYDYTILIQLKDFTLIIIQSNECQGLFSIPSLSNDNLNDNDNDNQIII